MEHNSDTMKDIFISYMKEAMTTLNHNDRDEDELSKLLSLIENNVIFINRFKDVVNSMRSSIRYKTHHSIELQNIISKLEG